MEECDGRRFLGRRRDREEACFICGHYHDHENGEPCSICGHTSSAQAARDTPPASGVLPSGIIPGELYLGSYDTASRSELLKTIGITHILNTVPTCQTLFKNTFTYHTASSSPPDFTECYEFIESVRKSGGKVLVFCMSGVSRSPTVLIAYLMYHRKWRLAESYKWVKDKRAGISINEGDAKRLADLELQLYKSSSVPPGGLNALNTPSNLFSFSPAPQLATCTANFSDPNTALPSLSGADAAGTGPSTSSPFGSRGSSWTMPTDGVSLVTFGSGAAGGVGGLTARAPAPGAAPPVFVFGAPNPVSGQPGAAVDNGAGGSAMET